MNSTIYEPRQRSQVRNLSFRSSKWETVCTQVKQMKCSSPTKTFWRKNLRIVKVDPSEILDRVFCRCGLVDIYQDAIDLTAMDKRQFAPPIESDWERVVNMANTCETFKINSSTTARLINHGFNSITLLSMAVDFEERGVTGDRLKQCLSVLNDKRSHPLEPSYSLQRLINTRRKHWYIMKKYQFLDLANVDLKKPPPPSRDCKLPEPMIAKTTFNNFDAPLVFGPRRPCTCPEKPRKLLSSVSSGSSGYSSGSSSLDLPDSPDSLKSFSQVCKIGPESPKSQKIIVPQPVPRPRRLQRPYGPGSMGKTHQEPLRYKNQSPRVDLGFQVHCPRPDCKWKLHPHQVEDHCAKNHGIGKGGVPTYAYKEVYQPHGNESRTYKACGEVKFILNAKDVINNESNIQLWWGPFPFVFDNVTFYQLVYKKTENEASSASRNESQILFWIWAALPKQEACKYRYEIHLDTSLQPSRHYSGWVQSLEVSSNDLIQHHMRSIVFFKQSFIRKAIRFNHQQPPPPPKTLDMKYTVKIMRQSL